MTEGTEREGLPRTSFYKRAATEAYLKTMLPLAEKISRDTLVEYPDNFWETIAEPIKDHSLLVIIPGHDSLHNGPTVSIVTRDITLHAQRTVGNIDDFKGFVVPVAQSLINGDQGYFLQRLFQSVEREILNDNDLYVVGHTRPKDREVYGTPPNRKEYIEQMRAAIKANFSVVIFPEGEAGKGLVDFKQDALPVIAKLAHDQGRKPVYVPVGISGDPKVFYTSKVPTTDVLSVAAGINTGSLVKVKVGMPIISEDLNKLATSRNKNDVRDLNQFLGQRIAELLPEEERGVFSLELSAEPKKF